MPLTSGTRIGPYEVGAPLGAGGMGEVYRATDTDLKRPVALKVLPESLASDAERVARFQREAEVLAALNHPHIAQIYGLARSAGVTALAMELVEGDDLNVRILRGRVPLDEALAIARQIAEALEAAHDLGIVHRDLKPSNVKVRPDGTVKVLDFGLARSIERDVVASAPGDSPTVTSPAMTTPGVILGTAAYMAPEQARGRLVDRRADVWALGTVLYEMLTGQRAFRADDTTDTIVAVLSREPDWTALPAETPAPIRRLLQRCLVKDPKSRLDSAAAVRLEIDDATAVTAQSDTSGPRAATPTPRAGRRTAWWWLAAAAAIGAAVAIPSWARRATPPNNAPPVLRLQRPSQVTNARGVENSPVWSPDGSRIAYAASDGGYGLERSHDIWVSQPGGGDAVSLTGGAGDNMMPSWSPDGRDIAFFSNRSGAWAVYTMPAIGGPARQLLAPPDMNGGNWSAPQWSRDGKLLHVSLSVLGRNIVMRLELASLQSTTLTLPDHDGTVVWDLSLSPGGDRYAYVSGGGGQTEVTRLWTIDAAGRSPVALTDGLTNVWSPLWSNDGITLYYISNRGGAMDLWQQRLLPDGTAVGDPVAVTTGVGMRSAAFSADGRRLAYSRGSWISNVWRVPLLADRPATWNDATAITSERAYLEFVDVSPDGTQLAVSSDRRGNQDLWLLPSAGGDMVPLSSDPTPDWNPRWSPDGRQIVFYSARSGNRDIWVMPSTGGPARQLTVHPRRESEPAWSPDGRDILFRSRGPQAAWIVSAEGGEPRLLAEGYAAAPSWSPDGLSVLLRQGRTLFSVPREGGAPTALPTRLPHEGPNQAEYSPDRQAVYYSVISGQKEQQAIWKLSLKSGRATQLTKLEGRSGNLSYYFDITPKFIYFTWREDEGDIWVMNVDDAAPPTR